MSNTFVWASAEPFPPARWDLRHLGWTMRRAGAGERRAAGVPWLLDGRHEVPSHAWDGLEGRAWIVAIGVEDAEERARMLRGGLGEALPLRIALSELAVRLTRLRTRIGLMPRQRMAGPVRLDLFHRDARLADRWLGLHPREFGLLWRLAERPDRRVDRGTLLADVWRLAHVPETNSLEVHVSRLRSKLATCGLTDLILTDPRGGYRLASGARPARSTCALDSGGAIGNHEARPEPGGRMAHAVE